MRALLVEGDRPGAVFCTNDKTAVGAMRAQLDAGVMADVDAGVARYNCFRVVPCLQTSLTSVRTDIPAVGREAVARLIAMIDGYDPESLQTAPSLIARESSSMESR